MKINIYYIRQQETYQRKWSLLERLIQGSICDMNSKQDLQSNRYGYGQNHGLTQFQLSGYKNCTCQFKFINWSRINWLLSFKGTYIAPTQCFRLFLNINWLGLMAHSLRFAYPNSIDAINLKTNYQMNSKDFTFRW